MWEKFKWFVNLVFKYNKSAYPKTKLGARLIFSAAPALLVGGLSASMKFNEGYIIKSINLTNSDVSIYSLLYGVTALVVGIFLIYTEWKQKSRYVAKVLISALPGMSDQFPDDVLDHVDREFSREAVSIGVTSSSAGDIDAQVRRYNAELEVDVFDRFILHDCCKRLYIGGLARVPILVSYGAMLRNVSGKVLYFDKTHKDGEWGQLDDENINVEFVEYDLVNSASVNGDVGLAIAFTTPMTPSQLPEGIREFTTILSPNGSYKRNLIKNQENLESLSLEVQSMIDKLSAVSGCERVHLFLSVQSSMALELGRRFQEGTHKKWVVHNFDADSGRYNWAVELSKGGISLFEE